jgi:hypothetical protein
MCLTPGMDDRKALSYIPISTILINPAQQQYRGAKGFNAPDKIGIPRIDILFWVFTEIPSSRPDRLHVPTRVDA